MVLLHYPQSLALFLRSGPVDTGNDSEISLNLNFTEHVIKTETFVIQADVDSRNQLELFWDIDTLGVKSDEPSEVHTNFKNNLVFNGAQYEITLSFKSNHPLLADNYVQCSVKKDWNLGQASA